MNVLKSTTTQNVAAGGTIAGLVIAGLVHFFPAIADNPELQTAIIVLINAVGLPIVSRLLAFSRNPEKK